MNDASPYQIVEYEVGNPIDLSTLHPVSCDSLARIGNAHDGGYVVPVIAVKAADNLISFGLAHDWQFERDFKKHNPTAVVHCYDHTVSLLTTLLYSLGQFLRFLVWFKPNCLRNSFAWIDYISFFRRDRIHFRQRLWSDHQNNSATIEDVFRRLPAGSQNFVKMDIEGGEYRVLDDLLQHSNNIVAIAIEFHDVDILSDRFNSLVQNIKRDFYIVHIHGNNFGGTTPFNFPMAPEITFLNKRFLSAAPRLSALAYPIPGLDHPNHPNFPDFSFRF